MKNEKYKLRYLPLFEQDLIQTISYITNVLKNTDAAEKLVNDIEDAIQERLEYPLAFEPFPSKKRDYPYYRIYMKLCNILCCYRGCNGSQKISLWSKRYKSVFIK